MPRAPSQTEFPSFAPNRFWGADGKPQMVATSKHIKAQADSALKHGVIGALIGGGLGLFVGAFPAILTGSGAVWAGAIAGSAIVGGGIGASRWPTTACAWSGVNNRF
ncbi:MAG: hypothetical protein KF760_15120 [Candidatus Eremiobacteraeota bacterium]|nr:hypothetical protein [Candidatus Eremiobacteraeota bacterium]MCW5866370.1 hypothetical protein [Candidatus Eremiobacteraeota bacterium]